MLIKLKSEISTEEERIKVESVGGGETIGQKEKRIKDQGSRIEDGRGETVAARVR